MEQEKSQTEVDNSKEPLPDTLKEKPPREPFPVLMCSAWMLRRQLDSDQYSKKEVAVSMQEEPPMDQDKSQPEADNSKEPLSRYFKRDIAQGTITSVEMPNWSTGAVRRVGTIFKKEIVFHFSER